ncbi:hypothetical protein DSECCO2_554300 [anaerobic digester metagenome]
MCEGVGQCISRRNGRKEFRGNPAGSAICGESDNNIGFVQRTVVEECGNNRFGAAKAAT